jgi:hypothetical protein
MKKPDEYDWLLKKIRGECNGRKRAAYIDVYNTLTGATPPDDPDKCNGSGCEIGCSACMPDDKAAATNTADLREGITYEADDGTVAARRDGILLWHSHIYGNHDTVNEVETAKLVAETLNARAPAVGAGGQKHELMRQAVASVVSRKGDEFRVSWLRPERVQVGTLLYCAIEQKHTPRVTPEMLESLNDAQKQVEASAAARVERHERLMVEETAKKIYATFPGADKHPWVEGGNSNMQYKARDLARAEIAATQETPAHPDCSQVHPESALPSKRWTD